MALTPNQFDTVLEEQERTSVLANERTYAAWIRTGLTSLAAGVAMERLLLTIIPPFTNRLIGTILIACSGLFFLLAAWRYWYVGSRLRSSRVSGTPIVILCLISFCLIIVSLIALLGVWQIGRFD